MTDNTNTETAAADSKVKTVLENMESRKLFATPEEAGAYLAKQAEELSDFGDHEVVAVGLTAEGDFNPEIYNETMDITVAKMTEKGSKEKGTETSVRAIVIYPTPKLDALLADASARDWLAGLIAKEANLVALRPLRKAETTSEMAEAVDSMPTTIAEYITSTRETSSGILETYNSLWQVLKRAMGERFKSFALANLSKKELRKAMESASYAAGTYPHLETRQNKKGEPESYFELAAKFGLLIAQKEGLDPAIFERMLETRNDKVIDVAEDDDAEDFDLEAMAAKLTAKPDEAAADSNEAAEPAPTE